MKPSPAQAARLKKASKTTGQRRIPIIMERIIKLSISMVKETPIVSLPLT